jgi:hypothetical protein
VTQIAIPCADLKGDSPLTEEYAIGLQQANRRIVDVSWFSGNAVEFEDFKSTALEIFYRL